METLANLESFARSAERRSFSEAARQLGLTPAAVSRNVATLERNLGVRLFQRSTRKLTLTEVGERFLLSIGGNLDALQAAIVDVAAENKPVGVLKVSMSPAFGIAYIMPLLPAFLARHPRVKPEWHFENRSVDLVAEGYDAAIGGGFELSPAIVSRILAPLHIVAVASPAYLRDRTPPTDPAGLAAFSGIAMRSLRTGRVPRWTLRNSDGAEMPAVLAQTIVVTDPAAMREAARQGLGVALIAVADVLSDIERGDLVRLLPHWYADAGAISLYYASRTLLPTKTRVFVDFIAEAFKRQGFVERFAGSPRAI
jgi:DNA-binding transcriptional LysR family regulator